MDPNTQMLSHDDSDRQDLVHAQKADQTLKELWIAAEADNSEFLVINEVLQRQTTDQDGQKYTQIVLPVNHRQEVIKIAHSTPMAGHLGTKPTQYKIMKNFFWPGMANDIKRACQSCERCQKTAKRTHSTAPMQITTTFTEPFHRVALDIVGPLPRTKRKHMYILTYIDLASRYPDAEPLQSTTSQAVAEALIRIFS